MVAAETLNKLRPAYMNFVEPKLRNHDTFQLVLPDRRQAKLREWLRSFCDTVGLDLPADRFSLLRPELKSLVRPVARPFFSVVCSLPCCLHTTSWPPPPGQPLHGLLFACCVCVLFPAAFTLLCPAPRGLSSTSS